MLRTESFRLAINCIAMAEYICVEVVDLLVIHDMREVYIVEEHVAKHLVNFIHT